MGGAFQVGRHGGPKELGAGGEGPVDHKPCLFVADVEGGDGGMVRDLLGDVVGGGAVLVGPLAAEELS